MPAWEPSVSNERACVERTAFRLVIALAMSLAACGGVSNPPSLVNGLRLLAVRASPPEVGPGESVTLDSLVADPKGGGRVIDHLWIACRARPGMGAGSCAALASTPVDGGASGGPGGGSLLPCASAGDAPLCFAGERPVVTYPVASDALAGAPSGAEATVSLLLVTSALAGGAPACLTEWAMMGAPPSDCVIATKAFVVSNRPPALRNQNPTISSLSLDGAPLAAGVAPAIGCGSDQRLTLSYPASDAQPEPTSGRDGGIAAVETLLFSWFASDGTLEHARSDTTDLEDDYAAPACSAIPGVSEPVTTWVVIRDDRGGVGWIERTITVRSASEAGASGEAGAG